MAKATGTIFTRLGLNATPRPPYGSFAGKAAVTGRPIVRNNPMIASVGKMMGR